MQNNLDIETFKEIVRAGVLIAKANPDKDEEILVNEVVKMLLMELIESR